MSTDTTTSGPGAVHRVAPAESAAAIEILSTSFMADPISTWIFPAPDERARQHPDFFGIIVETMIKAGELYITDDHGGVAIWLDVDPAAAESPQEHAEFRGEFKRVLDEPAALRFLTLDDLMVANHPGHAPHAYLAFLGVRPQAQGRGTGTALLRHRIAALDAEGRAAYLEASSLANRRLYGRLGFEPIGAAVALPDGPVFHPMWRPPTPAA
jgi:ribosomal protein S18 acetylase RimI-like enzyme